MSTISLFLNVKPVSTNNLYVSNGYGLRLSNDARSIKKEIATKLISYSKEIQLFSRKFNQKDNYLKAKYIFYMPKEKFYTKKGSVAKRSGDVDNFVKCLNDGIFTFIGNINKGMDDSQILDMSLSKKSWDKNSFGVSVFFEICTL